MRRCLKALALSAACAATPLVANAHPHVFVDGGVDFVIGEGAVLDALAVTWRYDPFQTLYILSSLDITPDGDWRLSEEDRRRLIEQESAWAGDFDGTSHLSIDGKPASLARPTSVDVRLRGDQMEVTFQRDLVEPASLVGRGVEVAVYEKTYFYALAVTDTPRILGNGDGDSGGAGCAAEVDRFDPDRDLSALQVSLFALSREETPDIEDVGALFADRIVLTCE
ncbi:MAG: DUF1007 family protein [Pseudomonadota bacterium]